MWDAFTSDNEIERARMTELIERLSETMVKRRGGLWNPAAAGLKNAEGEHARVPFHAILARRNPRAHDHVLVAEGLDDATSLWEGIRGRPVARTASGMAAAVLSMLRNAEVVVLVDPHFGPENRRHREPLREFLRAVVDARPCERPPRVEVHCSADRGATEEFFRNECQRWLPRIVPPGLRVLLVRLRQRSGGERLHNRYILTDLGGVTFGVGLDEGDPGESDDVQLLDRSHYEERWRQYTSDTPAFDRPEPSMTIEGVTRAPLSRSTPPGMRVRSGASKSVSELRTGTLPLRRPAVGDLCGQTNPLRESKARAPGRRCAPTSSAAGPRGRATRAARGRSG